MLTDVPLYVRGELSERSTPDAHAGFMIAGYDVVQNTIRQANGSEVPDWSDADLLAEAGDGPWSARLRRHQSWYREVVLGLPPGDHDGRPVASLLPQWAVDQDPTLNFVVSDEVHAAVLQRLRLRGEGGIVEPKRLFHNLLSSQPLCFNLFGMLKWYPKELALGLSKLLDHDVAEIVDLRIEYAPRVSGYRSGSAFDCYIEYRTGEDEHGFLGIETKYSEDLRRQKVSTNPVYEELIRTQPQIFRPEALQAVRQPATSQLIYNCALALKLSEDRGFEEGLARCLVLSCESDDDAQSAIRSVRACLAEPDDLLTSFSYERFLDALPFSNDLEAWKEHVRVRYLDLGMSS